MSVQAKPPFSYFTDAAGVPLSNGRIYIGTANTDPVTNPITVYSDAALTVTVPQPIRTTAGVPVVNGTPVNIYVGGNYAITVKDKNNLLVYTLASAVLAGGDITLASGETLTAQSGATVDLRSGSTLRLGDATGSGVAIIVDAPTRVTGNWVPSTSGTRLGQLTNLWDLFARNITMSLALLPTVAGVPFIGSLTLPFLTVIARTLSAKSAAFYSTAQPISTAELVNRTQLDCMLAACNQTNAGAAATLEELKNVLSIDYNGPGDYTVNFTRNIGTGFKVSQATSRDGAFIMAASCGATQCNVLSFNAAGAPADAAWQLLVFGNPGVADPIS
jgi:hypothetical protein